MPKKDQPVSLPVLRRLPRYYRLLEKLESEGVERISSIEIAKQLGLTASQIRQDLNCFGGFGQQGYGYGVSPLCKEIGNILHLNENLTAVLIGVGNLGRALCGYLSGEAKGITLIGLFDKNPNAAQTASGLPIMNVDKLDDFCKERHPRVAILCIPGENAQQTAEKLVNLGIEGFWNFSHTDLRLPDNILVEDVHLGDSLMTLGYRVWDSDASENNRNGGAEK